MRMVFKISLIKLPYSKSQNRYIQCNLGDKGYHKRSARKKLYQELGLQALKRTQNF